MSASARNPGSAEPPLDKARFFNKMLPEQRAALGALMRRVSYEQGAVLLDSGDLPPGLWLIANGRVQVSLRLPGDRREDVWVGEAGEVLGELSLIVREAHPIRVVALEPTEVWALDAYVFDGLKKQLSPLALAVAHAAARVSAARGRYVLRVKMADSVKGEAPPPTPWEKAVPLTPAELPLLQVLPMFRGVNAAQVAEDAAYFSLRRAKRGEPIFAEGEPPSSVALIPRGAVATSVTRAGQQTRLMLAGPGDLVGTYSFVDGRPQAVDATARERSLLLWLTKECFEQTLSKRPGLGLKILEALTVSAAKALQIGRRYRSLTVLHASSGTTPTVGPVSAGSA
jgi:CRP-like cAMP-binding protein